MKMIISLCVRMRVFMCMWLGLRVGTVILWWKSPDPACCGCYSRLPAFHCLDNRSWCYCVQIFLQNNFIPFFSCVCFRYLNGPVGIVVGQSTTVVQTEISQLQHGLSRKHSTNIHGPQRRSPSDLWLLLLPRHQVRFEILKFIFWASFSQCSSERWEMGSQREEEWHAVKGHPIRGTNQGRLQQGP